MVVLLVGLAFVQNPGFLVADTKFDLAEEPVRFLERALHLWDPVGAFGQLQNQAYGYLWPMGPFFALGDLLSLDGWVVQRLWLALVMVTAFLGATRVVRELGVRSDLACLVAGLAYALSPRLLSTLGPISIEAWPSAVAPWVLLPLVIGASRGSARRMALLAGLGVAAVGGVNAVATFAVIPVGAVWLLTRSPGPRRRALMLWWPVFTLLGTLWWLVPLFVMGAYSPPFLDFIETASVTTFPTTPFDALRGTSAWVPYLDPTWQGGVETVRTGYLALNSGVLLMLGLVGLAARDNPHRLFLAASLCLGLLLVTMGHQGSTEGWFAGVLNAQLDQVLAPLRNVHKFDPVVRLPLVVGLAWAVDRAVAAWSAREPRRRLTGSPLPVVGLTVVALAGTTLPAVTGSLTTTRPVVETPGYWQETAAWLADRPGDEVALLAPGSSFGSYLWGEPRDEPMQYLARSPWAVRNAIPLTPPGNIRMLDAFERRLAQGEPSTGLADYLRRMGVRYVVVRNDLSPVSGAPDPALVRQALSGSPDVRLVTAFGPVVGGEPSLRGAQGRVVVDGGWQTTRRAIEVYEVAGASRVVAADRLPVVVGGPEDLLDLSDAGILRAEPTRLAVDLAPDEQPSGAVVLTDGLLDRERSFGRVHDAYSSVRTPGDVPRSGNPTADYGLDPGTRWRTTARLVGARSLAASSSTADSDRLGGSRPGELPYAAVDGSPSTSWVAGADGPAWWEVRLDESTYVDMVEVTVRRGRPGQVVRVRTAAGAGEPVAVNSGTTTRIPVPPGETGWIRVEDAGGAAAFSLAEVVWDGRDVDRQLVLPALPQEWGAPDAVLLRALRDHRTGCATVAGAARCLESRARPSEEPLRMTRVVPLQARDMSYPLSVTAVPRPGASLSALVQRDRLVTAATSSEGPPDARASAAAAVDGDPGTAWSAALDDATPQLALVWLGERRITGLRVRRDPGMPVRLPTVVRLSWDGGSRTVDLGPDGRATFPPTRADGLRVRVLEAEDAVSVEPDGSSTPLPVGVGEIRLRGADILPVPPSPDVRLWDCGTGPTLTVNGRRLRTALQASPAELFGMTAVPAVPCRRDTVRLEPGENVVVAEASEVAAPDTIRLGELGPVQPAARVVPVDTERPDPVTRRFDPIPGATVVATRENANPGWQVDDVDAATPVVLDGWQQGWRVDGSGEPLVTRFAPDDGYRLGLASGAVLLVLLLGLALVPARRWPGADRPATQPRRVPSVALGVAAVLVSGLLVGWPGVACALLAAGLARAARSTVLDELVTWLTGGLVVVAASAYFLRPWGSVDGWAGELAWPHYLVALAVSFVVLRAGSRRPRSRIAGSSTTR
ncbi:alpha-(1-_3)-arabinofuranosyltransferase family protein [Nocardioides sp. GCM10027113]|uniref:alpha-(1->3)-arabinofuranosyltransferase domain-containing protein n=1 Tax=unclassified Nocardioides TaxID=2615069 RepID=UPI00361EF198